MGLGKATFDDDRVLRTIPIILIDLERKINQPPCIMRGSPSLLIEYENRAF